MQASVIIDWKYSAILPVAAGCGHLRLADEKFCGSWYH